LDLQSKNPPDVTAGALQPKGAGATAGSPGAKDAAQQIDADRLKHFKPEPEEPTDYAERVLTETLHPQFSNGAGAAVNS
jgi:hypothetical protein